MPVDSIIIERHIIHAREYFANALELLQRGEAGKAGELFWGSVAQALQAVAAYKNIPVRTHRELKNFAITLAKELADPALLTSVNLAEGLHSNYYEVALEPRDVAMYLMTSGSPWRNS
jgi:hypothetical protein